MGSPSPIFRRRLELSAYRISVDTVGGLATVEPAAGDHVMLSLQGHFCILTADQCAALSEALAAAGCIAEELAFNRDVDVAAAAAGVVIELGDVGAPLPPHLGHPGTLAGLPVDEWLKRRRSTDRAS